MYEHPLNFEESTNNRKQMVSLPAKVAEGLSHYPELERTLVTVAEALSETPGVVGVVLSGSVALGKVDPFSDIDLLAVVTEEDFEAVWNCRRDIEATAGDVVFRIDLTEVMETSAVAFYTNGVKAHLTYVKESSLEVNSEYRDAVCLFSTSHSLGDWLMECQTEVDSVDLPRLDQDDHRFWFWLLQGVAKLERGEIWAAYDSLQTLRTILVTIRENSRGLPFQGFRRIEERWEEAELKALLPTVAGLSVHELHSAYLAVLAAYDNVRGERRERLGFKCGVTQASEKFSRELLTEWLSVS